MLKFAVGTISFLIEPAFIEVKAVLAGYLLAHRDFGSAMTALLGVLFCLAFMNVVAYFEGTKSLWSIHQILGKLPVGSLQVADTISAATLESRYGYIHHAFRFGPFAQDAGNMALLWDKSGSFLDYQCAFNMLGNSYLFVPTETKLEAMPLYQKYLALHEIGHGSLMGGVIWTRAKPVIASGLIACAFGLLTSELGYLGLAAIMIALLATLLSSRKIAIESEAEVFADSYAIRHIEEENRSSATALVKKLIERLTDVDHLLNRYDQLINASRVRNLKLFEQRLEAGKNLGFIAHPSIRWLHYIAAIILFFWTVRYTRPDTHSGWLSALFAVLVVAIIFFRIYAIQIMLKLDRSVRSAIGRQDLGTQR
jgi:hypothetical protein